MGEFVTPIPDDVERAARRAYSTPILDDGSSLISLVSKDSEDYVLAAIGSAILAERAARGAPVAYLRVYPKDGSRFLALAAMTGPLPEIQTMDNGTIIHNTPLYG